MTTESQIYEFFREVQKAILKHGFERVVSQLRRIQFDNVNIFEKDVAEFILTATANHYCLDRKDVLMSKKRGVLSEARRMGFALMKEHLPFTDEEIGQFFNGRSRQYVNNELMRLPLNNDKLSTKQDNKFVNDFLNLTTMVVKYKNEYNENNKIKE
jgi:hypothetical protein